MTEGGPTIDQPQNIIPEQKQIVVTDGDLPTPGTGGNFIPHVPGVNSSEGDATFIDPNRTDTAPEDIARAEAIATAANAERSTEANQRLALKAMDDFAEKRQAIREDPRAREEHPEYGTIASEWSAEQHDKLEDETKQAIEKAGSRSVSYPFEKVREEANGSADELGRQGLEREREGFRYREEKARINAERLEEWAAIIHDRPLSDEYKARFPDVEFGPEDLVAFEDDLEDQLSVLEQAEKALAEIGVYEIVAGIVVKDREHRNWDTSVYTMIANVSRSGSGDYQELVQQWKELSHDKTKTIGDLTDFYKEQLDKGWLNGIRNNVNLTKAVLEDIKTGRASDPLNNEPAKNVEATATVASPGEAY